MKAAGEVWVYIQQQENRAMEASLEVLGKAAELAAALGVPVAGVLAGPQAAALADSVIASGAERVYVLESPLVDSYTTTAFSAAIYDLVRNRSPQIVLMAATPQGRDLAPRLASSLRVGLTADCTDLQIGTYRDPKTKTNYKNILLQIRPAWGGNIIATIVNPETRPQMATIREGIMKLPEPNRSRTGEVIRVPAAVGPQDVQTEILQRQLVELTVDLKKANIIVAGGAGMGSRERFALVRQLAHVLGGEVGATRAAVDAGFIDHDHQVGQTGISVRPKLYIACGISGAVQHLTGMEESGKIVAINTDPEAPIFGVAHYGIVGDVQEVLPRLIREYKSLSH
ncbi:electron transfer flavoprotein subunit alpha/FixB family protein [Thermodesulfobacteriota bacterium]